MYVELNCDYNGIDNTNLINFTFFGLLCSNVGNTTPPLHNIVDISVISDPTTIILITDTSWRDVTFVSAIDSSHGVVVAMQIDKLFASVSSEKKVSL